MERWRYVVASGIVVALAGALGFVLLRDPEVSPPSTTVTTTSTTAPSTTSTTLDRTEEVRLLLVDLYFGWFDAIYRKDPDALWDVVATEEGHAAGVAAMETLTFIRPPTRESMSIDGVEVLLDREDCLVVYSEDDFSEFRGPGADGTGVDVLWPSESHGWRFAAAWAYKNDLWISDCDYRTREETP